MITFPTLTCVYLFWVKPILFINPVYLCSLRYRDVRLDLHWLNVLYHLEYYPKSTHHLFTLLRSLYCVVVSLHRVPRGYSFMISASVVWVLLFILSEQRVVTYPTEIIISIFIPIGWKLIFLILNYYHTLVDPEIDVLILSGYIILYI